MVFLKVIGIRYVQLCGCFIIRISVLIIWTGTNPEVDAFGTVRKFPSPQSGLRGVHVSPVPVAEEPTRHERPSGGKRNFARFAHIFCAFFVSGFNFENLRSRLMNRESR